MGYQVIIGLDNSMSMQTAEGGTTRVKLAQELAGGIIAAACQVDADGPDVFTFGQSVRGLGTVTVERAQQALAALNASEPATATGAFLTQAFSLAKKKIEGGDQALILVVTDGAASDAGLVKSEIIKMSQWMQADEQCAVEFISISHEADAFLRELDDDLQRQGAKFDIVDATPIQEAVGLGLEGIYNKAFND